MTRCGFRRGVGRLPLRGSTPCRPKGSPFVLFLRYSYLLTVPKMFLKASSTLIYNNFEGERAPKKRDILSKFSKMFLKMLPFGLFVKNFACGAEILAKTNFFSNLGSSESQYRQPKKKMDKISEKMKIFYKIRSPPHLRKS